MKRTAGEEWRAHWGLVAAAMVGLSFGAIPAATLGLFMEPLEAEFGWSRAMISGGMMVFALIGLPLTPFAGALADKIGSRACVIPGLALSGLAFAGFGLMTGAAWMWWMLWVAYGLSSLLIRSMIWNAAVSAAFSASRGLAIAFVLSGFALAQVVGPPLAHFLIEAFDWRVAYFAIGIGWPAVGLLLTMLFFRSNLDRKAAQAKASGNPGPATSRANGLTLGEAARDQRIVRIGLALFLSTLMGAAISIHLVPLLEWSGSNRTAAAGLAGMLGIGSFAGKILSGILIDRIRSGLLPAAIFALPALGYFLIWQGHGSFAILAAGVLCMGFGSGGALQVGTYLTTRYGGLANFGKIFGVISSAIALGGGIAPVTSGWIYDTTGSYALVLTVAVPVVLLAGLLLLGLGDYPDYDAKEQEP
ncbi:MAG: MFS transporter [Sphingomonadaceae bacterium]